MRRAIYILIFCVPALLFSQSKEKLNSKLTFRGYVGIPRIVGSKMFKTAFSGIVETGLSANVRVNKNFYVGGGYSYINFQVNKKEWSASVLNASGGTVTSVFYKTELMLNSGFVKLGHDYFFSDIGYVSTALNVGYAAGEYGKVLRDTSLANRPYPERRFKAPYFQPEITFNFLAEKRLSFSLLLSYTMVLYRFDARVPRFNHINEINGVRNRANINWLNIGIGFNVLLGKDK